MVEMLGDSPFKYVKLTALRWLNQGDDARSVAFLYLGDLKTYNMHDARAMKLIVDELKTMKNTSNE